MLKRSRENHVSQKTFQTYIKTDISNYIVASLLIKKTAGLTNQGETLFLFSEGVMIAIECKAWAKNIKHDSMERRGLAHFEVYNL